MRIKERTSIDRKGKAKFFKEALQKGLCVEDAINKGMSKTVVCYLKKLSRFQKAKIYKNYVFIYSKGNKTLYTVYECPKNIQEELKKEAEKKE
jgi:hypothetical protein